MLMLQVTLGTDRYIHGCDVLSKQGQKPNSWTNYTQSASSYCHKNTLGLNQTTDKHCWTAARFGVRSSSCAMQLELQLVPHWADRTSQSPHPQLQQRDCSHDTTSMQEPARSGTAEVNYTIMSPMLEDCSLFLGLFPQNHTYSSANLNPWGFSSQICSGHKGSGFLQPCKTETSFLKHPTGSCFCTWKPSEDLHTCAPLATPQV